METPTTIERSIWIAAPREQVWQALTDADQLAKWLMPPIMAPQLKRDENGTLSSSWATVRLPSQPLKQASRHAKRQFAASPTS
jgi:uncharacterized protein YndB with AHSA1/START domain